MDTNYLKPTFNTLRATRLELFMARLFGKKQVNYADGFKITTRIYKNKVYLVNYK